MSHTLMRCSGGARRKGSVRNSEAEADRVAPARDKTAASLESRYQWGAAAVKGGRRSRARLSDVLQGVNVH